MEHPRRDTGGAGIEGGGVMTDAPERIWAWVWDLPYPSRLNMRPEWNSDMYPADQNVKEYIRADLVDAIIFAAQAVIDRWDSPDWKDEKHTADYINVLRRALNTPETRAEILAEAMKSSTLKGQTDDT